MSTLVNWTQRGPGVGNRGLMGSGLADASSPPFTPGEGLGVGIGVGVGVGMGLGVGLGGGVGKWTSMGNGEALGSR